MIAFNRHEPASRSVVYVRTKVHDQRVVRTPIERLISTMDVCKRAMLDNCALLVGFSVTFLTSFRIHFKGLCAKQAI